MVGLRIFDIGALIICWWFFKLRDDEDDEGGGGPGGGGGGPDGGPPLPDAGPWPRRRRDHLGDLFPALLTRSTRFARFGGWPGSPRPHLLRLAVGRSQRPVETHAYVVALNTGTNGDSAPDALTVLDLEAGSSTYGQLVGRLDMPNVGDELHHFGWNACSSALCPWAPHPHSSAAICSCPACAPRASTWSTSRTIRTTRRSRRSSSPRRSRRRPATRGRTRSTAGPTGSTSPRSATPRATGRADLPARPRQLLRQGRVGARPRPQELAYDFWWHLTRHGHHL